MSARVVKVLAQGLVVIDGRDGPRLHSTRCLRKARQCQECGATVPKGEIAYGEVTSGAHHRKDRYCEPCVEAGALALL